LLIVIISVDYSHCARSMLIADDAHNGNVLVAAAGSDCWSVTCAVARISRLRVHPQTGSSAVPYQSPIATMNGLKLTCCTCHA